MADVFANNATLTTTSTSGTDAPAALTSETWTVNALSALWPALSGSQTMSIQDPAAPSEISRITASSGSGDTSITVTRGVDGTTPVAHAAGATFVNVAVASALNAFGSGSGGSVSSATYNVATYGALGGAIHLSGGSNLAASTATYSNAGANFTQADVGKTMYVMGAGVTTDLPFRSPILAVINATTCTLNAYGTVNSGHSSGTTVTNTDAYYGWSMADTAGLQAAVNAAAAAGGGTVVAESALLLDISSPSNLPNTGSITYPSYAAPIFYACAGGANVTVQGMTLYCPLQWNTQSQSIFADPGGANGFTLDDCYIDGGNAPHIESEQYGMAAGASTDWVMRNCTCIYIRSKSAMGLSNNSSSPVLRMKVVDNHLFPNGNAIGGIYCQDCDFSSNFIYGAVAEDILFSGFITNCTINDNVIESLGCHIGFGGQDVTVSGNHITMLAQAFTGAANTGVIEFAQYGTSAWTNVTVTDNIIDLSQWQGTALSGISFGSTVLTYTNLMIANNQVIYSGVRSPNSGINIGATPAGAGCTVIGNTVINGNLGVTGGAGTTGNLIIGNKVVNGSLNALAGVLIFADNVCTGSMPSGVNIGASPNIIITGNYFNRTDAASSSPVLTMNTGCNHWSASNNYMQAATITAAVLIDSTNGIWTGGQVVAAGTHCINETGGGANNEYIGLVGTGPSSANIFTALGTGTVYRDCPGANPVGSVSVAVPASGSPVAAAAYDRLIYVTAGVTSVSCAVTSTGTSSTIVVPAAGCIPIRVPGGQTMTPTYTNAPTFVTYGD